MLSMVAVKRLPALAGSLFALLRKQRGNILVPFGAHLALNFVETLLLWLAR
ncbi:MAG TPA: hypothetical protein VFR47_26535 [Anaerolineales bacterium]|nr:hypothetical protein [Anaerolineales bacterium]